MTVQTKPMVPAGAVEISGRYYLRNGNGDLVAVDNIKPADLLIDEMVVKQLAYARDLSAEMARFQSYCFAETGAMDAVLDQQYGVKRPEKHKGNRSYTSYDGSLQVKVSVAEQLTFGPELQSAKKLLDEMILEKSAGADPFLVTLVNQAFAVDQEGKVDRSSIFALAKLEVPDPRWPDIQAAIKDATRVSGTKTYMRFYQKNEATGRMEMVALDLAAIAPTPEAFARRSLRRQVEDGRQAAAAALDHLMDGDVASAAIVLTRLCRDLGGAPSPDAAAWVLRGCEDAAVRAAE